MFCTIQSQSVLVIFNTTINLR